VSILISLRVFFSASILICLRAYLFLCEYSFVFASILISLRAFFCPCEYSYLFASIVISLRILFCLCKYRYFFASILISLRVCHFFADISARRTQQVSQRHTLRISFPTTSSPQGESVLTSNCFWWGETVCDTYLDCRSLGRSRD